MLKALSQWRHQRKLKRLGAQAQASLALQRILEPIEREQRQELERLEEAYRALERPK